MSVLRSFLRIVDGQTLLVTGASLLATWLCVRAGYGFDLPDGLIAIAVVFPLGFAINAGFTRREKVLGGYAAFKAHAYALFYAHRDWLGGGELAGEVRDITLRLFVEMRGYLRSANPDRAALHRVYDEFSLLSAGNERLRTLGVASAELARANRYVHGMMTEFEQLRNFRLYRTLNSMRAYAKLFLNTLPVLFAPKFAWLALEHGAPIGFLVAAVYSLILVSLDNIQDAIENPFDEFGEDDVVLDGAADFDMVSTPVEANGLLIRV